MSVTVHNLVSLHGATREVDVDMMPSNIQATDGKMQNLVLSPSSLTLTDLKKIRTWTQSVVGKSAVAYIGPTLTVSVEAAAAVPCILGNAVSTEGRFSIPGDCSDKAVKEEALRALADSGAMQYSDDEGSCRKWCKQKYPSLFLTPDVVCNLLSSVQLGHHVGFLLSSSFFSFFVLLLASSFFFVLLSSYCCSSFVFRSSFALLSFFFRSSFVLLSFVGSVVRSFVRSIDRSFARSFFFLLLLLLLLLLLQTRSFWC